MKQAIASDATRRGEKVLDAIQPRSIVKTLANTDKNETNIHLRISKNCQHTATAGNLKGRKKVG